MFGNSSNRSSSSSCSSSSSSSSSSSNTNNKLVALVKEGKMGPLFIGVIAFLITRYLTLPFYESHFKPALIGVLSDKFHPYYDPTKDDTLNLEIVGALNAYLCMCSLCTLMDCLPKITVGLKTQGSRSYFTVKEWCEAVGTSLVNFLVLSWAVLLPNWILHRDGALRGGTPIASLNDTFDMQWAIISFIAHMFIIDFWFYTTHYLLHCGILYKLIHKQHHKFKAPCSVACTYANPIEFGIGNMLGVLLGPTLTNCHPYMATYWMAFALTSTAGTHSGYYIFGAEDHDIHHELLNFNYGTGVFMDKLFGTGYKPDRDTIEKRKLKRLQHLKFE